MTTLLSPRTLRCPAPRLSLWLLAAVLPAQNPDATSPPARPTTAPVALASDTDRLHVDTGNPSTVWARGTNWKASFAADGVRFVPFLGSEAPRNFPLHLQLVATMVGAAALPLDLTSPPQLTDRRVTLARGACREQYALTPAHAEQLFVFDRPVGRGDLCVRMQVQTELAATANADGSFTFANELGGVTYGSAIAIDSAQLRTPVASHLADGVLTLTVPAAFVAAATFPLTIDPLLITFQIVPSPQTYMQNNADSAWLGTGPGRHATVFEEQYSQTDHDVYLRPFDHDGIAQAGAYVDFTTDYWTTPQVASHRGASQCLVVAAKGPATGNKEIWGRLVDFSTSTHAITNAGPQFAIYTSTGCVNPDVGGDPNPSPPLPGSYCVTWEWFGELYYRIVRTDASMLTAQWLDFGAAFVSNVRISKSCGVGPYATQEWILVWQKRYSPTDEDIWGSIVGVDGSLHSFQFLIDYSSYSDVNPEVSSKTDLIAGAERFLVTFERQYPATPLLPAHSGLVGNLCSGPTSLSGAIDLSALLQRSNLRNQQRPCTDSDGVRFAVGFSEWSPLTGQDSAPYLATVHVTGNTLGVSSLPEVTSLHVGPDERLQIGAERSGGSFTPRYMATWTTTNPPPQWQFAQGAIYIGHTNLPPAAYFNQTAPANAQLTLTASGLPALGNTFTLTLGGVQGLPFLLLGTVTAPVDPCVGFSLAVDPATMLALQTTSHSITVPPFASLIGFVVAAQGFDAFAPGACTAPIPFSLSNAFAITVL